MNAYFLAVVFAATWIRTTFGFGEALVAVPLLALVMPVEVAAPVAVLLSITIAAVVMVEDRREIHWRSAAWLLAPTLLGVPAGVWLLAAGHEALVKAGLGVVIGGFAAYFLWVRHPPRLANDSRRWLLGCGLAAGVLGGAYGMNGPPLVIYGSLRRWSPRQFRATLQAYFLPASMAAMAGYAWSGLWVPAVTHDYLLGLAALLPALLLGRIAHRRLQGELFLRLVHAGLLLVAVVLVAQALRG
ncbi:MAG TPA: sulfite exporter TauE/SafE family protein [Terriglobales bacterium]|nr:sulfite exporter TauE/SafE family protein [Terriglobales bacterium]